MRSFYTTQTKALVGILFVGLCQLFVTLAQAGTWTTPATIKKVQFDARLGMRFFVFFDSPVGNDGCQQTDLYVYEIDTWRGTTGVSAQPMISALLSAYMPRRLLRCI